jgi:flavin-dependent dehydrogenase
MICAAPSFLLDKVAGKGWLAVGDAACAFDPISSQGIYKALADGVHAARVIVASLRGSAIETGEYQISVAARFQHYLQNRNYFYGLERRWPTSRFWTRRQANTAVRAGNKVRA